MLAFKRDDIEIRYIATGPQDGRPVVLLHGFPDSHIVWEGQIRYLEEQGFRVIAPDLRGFGQSSKPDGPEYYKLNELRQDVIALLDHLSIDKCYLVGHDWGAALSWHIVTKNPERIRKLTVLSNGHHAGFFPNGGNEQRQRLWYMLLFNHPKGEEIISANDFALWRKVCEDEKPEIVSGRVDELKKEGALRAGLQWYKAIAPPEIFGRLEPYEVPRKIDVPTQGIWASRDVFLTRAQMEGSSLFMQAGRFKFHELEDSGHWMQLEKPDEINKLILDFINEPSAKI